MSAFTLYFSEKPHLEDVSVVIRQTDEKLPDVSAWMVVHPEFPWDIPRMPLITSLHVIGGSMTAFCYATPVMRSIPVTDAWLHAVGDSEGRAQVLMILEPLATPPLGLAASRGFVENVLSGKMSVAARDVPVTITPEVADLGGIDPHGGHGPKERERWATWRVEKEVS